MLQLVLNLKLKKKTWKSTGDPEIDILIQNIKRKNKIQTSVADGEQSTYSDTFKYSSKMNKLLSILTKIKQEQPPDKCVVFSQFTMYLDLIEPMLYKSNIEFVRYDGSMSHTERTDTLDEFENNSKVKVILVSTKAGAVALSLTAANHVFLLDPWWNPQIDRQAIDRVYRLGQKKEVYVYRFFAKDSIEEGILELQNKKSVMANNALATNGLPMQLTRLTIEEISRLLQLSY